MADIKISDLLPASTPLDGTETLPIVQAGNTVKASTQDIASLYSLGYTAEDVANKSTDSSFAGATDLRYPSQLAVKTYVDNTLGNAGWGLSGNSGTTSANFIGTTNAQDLVIKTNSTERLRIGANGGIQSLQYITSTNGVSSTAIGYGWIEMFNQSGGLAEINATNITGTKSLQLPNTNGTLVATVNGVAPDSAGNVSVSSGWSLTGNSGTTAGTNFIGTTDNQDVVFKRNSLDILRIQATFLESNISFKIQNNTSSYYWANTTSDGFAIIGASSINKGYLTLSNGTYYGQIRVNNITANRILQLPDKSGTLALENSTWGLTGNSGTTAGTNFIGTTDNQDLVFKTNNTEVFRATSLGSITSNVSIVANATTGISRRFRVINTANPFAIAEISIPSFADVGQLILGNGSASAAVKSTNLTASRILELPDKSGTLATEDYLVYTAIIDLSTLPTVSVNILKNTLGATISWTAYIGLGVISATASSSVFTSKTFINQTLIDNGGQPYFAIGNVSAANTINYSIIMYDGTQAGLPNNNYIPIEIRVYP